MENESTGTTKILVTIPVRRSSSEELVRLEDRKRALPRGSGATLGRSAIRPAIGALVVAEHA